MVPSLMKRVLYLLLTVCEHVLNALAHEIAHRDALVLRVVKLVLRNDLDRCSLILRHALEHESKTHLLIVVLEGEERRLVLQLCVVVLQRVDLQAHEVKLVYELLTPEHACLDVVHAHYQPHSRETCDLR